MSIDISYTRARDNLANYMERAIEENEVIKIHRKVNGVVHRVALIDADELDSILETAHLLRSPGNAERLYNALERTETQALQIASLAALRLEMGLDRDDKTKLNLSGPVSDELSGRDQA